MPGTSPKEGIHGHVERAAAKQHIRTRREIIPKSKKQSHASAGRQGVDGKAL